MAEAPGAVEVPHDENDPFVKKVALSVAVFAVVLVLAGAGGNNAGKEMLLQQMKASNEWSRYQAKTQREVLYQQERETLEGDDDPRRDPAQIGRRHQRLEFVTHKLTEYTEDKEKIRAAAEECEHERDVAARRDPYFEYAELALQLAVVLASVSMLSKLRWPYATALALAGIGLLLTANGYFLLVKAPVIDPTVVAAPPAH